MSNRRFVFWVGLVLALAACDDEGAPGPGDAAEVGDTSSGDATSDATGDAPGDAAGDLPTDAAADALADPSDAEGDNGEDSAADVPGGDAGDPPIDAISEDVPPDIDASDEGDLAADASDAADAADAEDVADAGDTGDEGDKGDSGCDYPIVWLADPSTQATAEAALEELVPDANPTWDSRRGTFSTILNINLALECPDGEDAWDPVVELIEANPTIFQIDLADWGERVFLPCSVIDDGNTHAGLARVRLGEAPVARDIANFILRRVEGEVRLTSFIATYVPPVPEEVASQMASCGSLTLDEAEEAVFATTFPYNTFDLCVPTGEGVYEPDELDTVEIDPDPRWSWGESATADAVELTQEHLGRLIIHPDNVTEELVQSNVNCPDESGDNRIYGFTLTFDAVLKSILSKMPGIGCIVC